MVFARESIRWGTIASLSLKAIYAVLAVVVSILLARWLGKDGYGVYAFAVAAMHMAAMPVRLGLPPLLVREVSRYQASFKWELMRGAIRRSNQIVGFAYVIVCVASLVVLYSYRHRLPLEQYHAHLLTLLILPVTALAALRQAALRGLKQVIRGQLPELLVQPALTIVFIVVAYRLVTPSPTTALAITFSAATIAFFVGVVMLRRALPDEVRQAKVDFDDRRWLNSLVPFCLTAFVTAFRGNVDIVLLGLLTTKAEVASYRVAWALGMLVVFAMSALQAVLAPHVAQLYEIGNRARLQSLITKSTWVITAVAAPTVAILIIGGADILELLYDVEYRVAYLPLVILCGGQFFSAVTGTVGMLLNMTGNERHVLITLACSVVLNIASHLVLIPRYGAVGAAISTALTVVFTNAMLTWNAWKILGIHTTPIPFAARPA